MSSYFVTPWPITCYSSLSMGFPNQEYGNWLTFVFLRDFLNLNIEILLPALRGEVFFFFLNTEPVGKPYRLVIHTLIFIAS